jgi:hypothetical protein
VCDFFGNQKTIMLFFGERQPVLGNFQKHNLFFDGSIRQLLTFFNFLHIVFANSEIFFLPLKKNCIETKEAFMRFYASCSF